jgi:hypothetical protein
MVLLKIKKKKIVFASLSFFISFCYFESFSSYIISFFVSVVFYVMSLYGSYFARIRIDIHDFVFVVLY